jgi:hypothetical protein
VAVETLKVVAVTEVAVQALVVDTVEANQVLVEVVRVIAVHVSVEVVKAAVDTVATALLQAQEAVQVQAEAEINSLLQTSNIFFSI